ncbi:hypothetical protein [endosymbiont 'TC1' of Trimyema compressum]|nr:hypothetical protein [endosymbiont 'TC1' of Trimyema compressum]
MDDRLGNKNNHNGTRAYSPTGLIVNEAPEDEDLEKCRQLIDAFENSN